MRYSQSTEERAVAEPDRAVSRDAVSLRRVLDEATDIQNTMYSYKQADMLVDLITACAEAAVENWDGYGAQPVRPGAYAFAEAFLRVLPFDLPKPEISVHPDGEVGLDWLMEPRKVFSLSIDDAGTLSFASLYGSSKVTGTEMFSGTFPTVVSGPLRRVMRDDPALNSNA